MSECSSIDEYNEKTERNHQIIGSGDDSVIHLPCFFCAEPDLMICPAKGQEAAHAKGAVCKHCGRGIRCIVNAGSIGWTHEFFQTCGPDIPSWLRPIRRIQSVIQ